ncbi:hypothetical protein C8A01DRAFT_17257 [Parachaetomium inaequale]|uniref:Uncharacterized protein n=1 Tax=Parachaetomium inaequale TaxID=2588326 RepID=A0AAN6PD40_9PEZI|nr:hypothetical protein C8A01DRAFT_17257 [Parachaetomium inaequale]
MGEGPGVGVLGEEGGRKLGVVFCRAGLWLGQRGSVLFLERDVWGDEAGARMYKARSRSAVGGQVDEEEITASMEDVVLEAVEEGWDPLDQLPGVIAEVVYHRWLELFDFLEPQPPAPCEGTAACYQRILRSLELNDEGEDYMPWTKLITRMKYRIELLPPLQDKPPAPSSTALKTTDSTPNTPNQATESQAHTTKSSFSRGGRNRRPRRTDENQRALDRLSYLGGILIPLPIVSSILSMGGVYGPDGSRFFVFWALAVPLAGLTVLLIYADTIRKAEVWIEIETDLVMPSPGGGGSESSSEGDTGPVADKVKHGGPVAWRRQRVNGDGEQPAPGRPDGVPFVADHDVEERIIDMPTAAAATASVQPEDEEVDWLPRHRWSMGWGQVPLVILERPADGSKPKAWKREQLGWSGAIRTILYKKFRDGSDVPEGVAACEKAGRRKTN